MPDTPATGAERDERPDPVASDVKAIAPTRRRRHRMIPDHDEQASMPEPRSRPSVWPARPSAAARRRQTRTAVPEGRHPRKRPTTVSGIMPRTNRRDRGRARGRCVGRNRAEVGGGRIETDAAARLITDDDRPMARQGETTSKSPIARNPSGRRLISPICAMPTRRS